VLLCDNSRHNEKDQVFRRKPRITEDIYGRLMTSFGRVVDLDPLVSGPAAALAGRVCEEQPALSSAVDQAMYRDAAHYHLRLLAGAWILSQEGGVPENTAEVFEEAVAWKFEPAAKGSRLLPERLSELARGEAERDTALE
jgi:hypothetical protein